MVGLEMVRILSGLTTLTEHFTGIQEAGGGIEASGPESFQTNGKYLAANLTSTTSSGSTLITSFALNRLDAKLRPWTRGQARWLNHRGDTEISTVRNRQGGIERREKRLLNQDPILWTIVVVEALEYTLGFGPAYDGEDLKVGSEQFGTVSARLTSAFPGESWQGPASQTYADRNAGQQERAGTLADLDSELAAIIANQADINTDVRLGFGTLKGLLFAAYIVEQLLFAMTPTASTAGRTWALTACILGNIAAAAGMATVLTFSYINKNKADGVAGQYQQLADGGTDTSIRPKAAAAQASAVSSFEATSSSRSGVSDPADGAGSAGVANRGREQRGALGAVPGAGATSGDATPGDASGSAGLRAALSGVQGAGEAAAVGAAVVAPTVRMPTLAEVSAWSGRAATLSGHASQHLNLVNQTMGSVQQITSMSQQTQPASAPAAEETPTEEDPAEAATEKTAGEGDGATAGTGSETAQRAPVEAAALDIHQTPQPDPVGHNG
ncbi:hypothetical protein A5641_10450 [Mycobacterium sp. 1554424.7]|nr:hypothetical protein A5641_10450 [Mycobacterium sp. 1554424.7]